MKILEKIRLNKEMVENENFNPDFIKNTQPMGNMIFKENYIQKGDGYETCIHIYSLPKTVNDLWLRKISEIENVITTLDITTEKSTKIINKLSKAISEYDTRETQARTAQERKRAEKNSIHNESLLDRVLDGEVIKKIHLRIFLYERTIEDLEKKVKSVLEKLEGSNFKSTIFLNELEDDFKSLQNSLTTQKEDFLTKRDGIFIESSTLGAGFNYHHSYLNDPKGTYIGTSFTGGNVIFDIFNRTEERKNYNGVLYGKQRAGKSTLLKKFTLTELTKGNRVRVFDASGEFNEIAKGFNSKFLALDGSNGIINPFQVLKSSFENENADNDRLSFQKHINKLKIFFSYFNPEFTNDDLSEIGILLEKFYIKLKLIKIDENNFKIYKGITDLKNEEYPILSDFFQFIKQEFQEENQKEKSIRIERLDKIQLTIQTMLSTYDSFFNGTSTISINDEDFIVFNIKSLNQYEDNIFNSIIFNILNILWQEMISNTSMLKVKDISIDDRKYLIFIDEAHRMFNSSADEKVYTFFENYMREAPKYLAGIWFSFHLLEDNISTKESISLMNKIFKLAQYKVIFNQDTSSKQLFSKVFSSELTESEIDLIPNFRTGECLLSISGYKNIVFKVSLGFEEEEYLLNTGGI
jgi:putative ATPase traE